MSYTSYLFTGLAKSIYMKMDHSVIPFCSNSPRIPRMGLTGISSCPANPIEKSTSYHDAAV